MNFFWTIVLEALLLSLIVFMAPPAIEHFNNARREHQAGVDSMNRAMEIEDEDEEDEANRQALMDTAAGHFHARNLRTRDGLGWTAAAISIYGVVAAAFGADDGQAIALIFGTILTGLAVWWLRREWRQLRISKAEVFERIGYRLKWTIVVAGLVFGLVFLAHGL